MALRPTMGKAGVPEAQMPNRLSSHAFDYDKCSDDELRTFLASRKLAKCRTREQAIFELQEADDAATLGFFDLLPELRNEVYRMLLALENIPHVVGGKTVGTKRKCHPQILATCKHATQEARAILYEENKFEVKFSVDASSGYVVDCEVCGMRPSNWDNSYSIGLGNLRTLPNESIEWPSYLRRAGSVSLQIHLPKPPPAHGSIVDMLMALNRCLYDLACFFHTGIDTAKLEVNISCDTKGRESPANHAKCLSPIRLFPMQKTFVFSCLASRVAEYVQRPLEEATESHQVIRAFRKLASESRLFDRMAEVAGAAEDPKDFDPKLFGVLDALGHKESFRTAHEFNTPETHRKVIQAVEKLHTELASANLSGIDGVDKMIAEDFEELRMVRKLFRR